MPRTAKDGEGFIILTMKIHKEDEMYLVLCEELGVSTFGSTHEEAIDSIREAVLVYLTTLETEGERERVFKDRGIKILKESQLRKQTVRVEAHFDECVMPSAFPVDRVAAAAFA